MAEGTIGTVYVAVVPSTKGFGKAAKAEIEAEAASLVSAAQAAATKQAKKNGGLLSGALGPDYARRWKDYEKFLKEQEKAAADSLRRQEKAEAESQERRNKLARERFDQAIRSENDLADHRADLLREEEKNERDSQRRRNQSIARSMQARYDMEMDAARQIADADRDLARTRERIARTMPDGSLYSGARIGDTLGQYEQELQQQIKQRSPRYIGEQFIDQAFNPKDMGHQIGRQMSNAGRRMTFSGSIAAALPVAAAGYFAAKFESELGRTMSVIDGGKFFGNKAQTEKLRQAAMQVSRDNPFTNIDVAQGMSELARAGLSYGEVLAGIEPATDIAIAGQMDLATASHTVAAAMGQFGLSSKDIPRIGDAMAVAANKSNASLQDLALSMEYVGPVAGSAGISLEETNAMLGLLGKQGIIASKAGTSLRSAFMSLTNPTDQATALMEKYGINVAYTSGKLKGQIKPLAGIADELHRATKGMSDIEKQDLLGSLFGKYGSAAGRILAKGGGDLRAFVNEIENSRGAAKKLAERSMSPLELSFRKLQGSVENFLVVFGNAMAPAITAVADGLAAIADAMSRMPQGALIALGTALTGIALAGPALWAAGGTIAGLRAVVGVSKAAKTALGALGAINVMAGGKKAGALGGVAYLAKSLGSIDFAKIAKSTLKKGIWTTVLFEAWDSLVEGWNFAQDQKPLEVKPPKYSQEWRKQKEIRQYLEDGFQSKSLKKAGAVPGGDFFGELTQGAGAALSAIQDLIGAIWEVSSLGSIFTAIGSSLGLVDFDWGDFVSGATNAIGNVTQLINQLRIGLLNVQIQAKETWADMLDALNLENQADAVRAGIQGLQEEKGRLQSENRKIDLRTEMSLLPEGQQVKIDKALTAAEQATKQVEHWAEKQVIKAEMKMMVKMAKDDGSLLTDPEKIAKYYQDKIDKANQRYSRQSDGVDVKVNPKTEKADKAIQRSVNKGKPVPIRVEAKTEGAKNKIEALERQIKGAGKGKDRVNVKANVTGRGEVRDLKGLLKDLKGERVRVNVNGADKGKKDVADLIAELEKLAGKNPNTVTVKQEGAEAAAAQVSNLIFKLAALDSMAPVVTVSIQADATGYYEALAALPSGEGRSLAPSGGGEAPVVSPAAYGASEGEVSAAGVQARAPKPSTRKGGGGGSKGGTTLSGILDEILQFSKDLQGMGVNAIQDGMKAIKDAIGNKKWGDDAKKQIDKEMEKLRQTLQKRTDKLKEIYENFFAELSGNAIDPRWLGREGDADSLADVLQGLDDNLVLALEKLNGKGLDKAEKKAEKERRKRLQKTVRAYRKEAKDQIKELRNIEAAREFRDEIKDSAQTSADLSRVRSGAGLGSYITRMTKAITDARSGVEALATKGLPLSLLQQIMRQDPATAAKWVKRLQAMPQADFDALKQKWNAYQRAGADYASYGTNAVFGDTVGTSFEDGLLAREKEIQKFFNRMGVAIAESFEIALGMDNTKWKNAPAQKRLNDRVNAQSNLRTPRGAGNRHGGANGGGGNRGDNVTVNVHAGASESAKDVAHKTARELSWKQKKRRNRR